MFPGQEGGGGGDRLFKYSVICAREDIYDDKWHW